MKPDFSSVRSLERWKFKKFSHDGIASFLSLAEAQAGLHTVFEAGLPIDIYVDIQPGCPLVVMLNGAAQRSETLKLPVLAGFGVIPTEGVSRICINDPSLYLDPSLGLAWYAGSADLSLQTVLPQILTRLFDMARPSKIVFMGGSGGGFASIYYARFFPNSLALVWNPQTNILEYAPVHVAGYAKAAFGCADFAEAMAVLPSKIHVDLGDVCAGHDNYLLYLQNRTDWHVKKHLAPFVRKMGYAVPDVWCSRFFGPRFYLHMADFGEGHAAPPASFTKSLLSALLAYDGSWKELFDSGELVFALDSSSSEG